MTRPVLRNYPAYRRIWVHKSTRLTARIDQLTGELVLATPTGPVTLAFRTPQAALRLADALRNLAQDTEARRKAIAAYVQPQ